MTKPILTAVLLLILGSIQFAQQIYFCKSYTEDGVPIDENRTWEFEQGGISLNILFDNEGDDITQKLLYIFIDKKYAGSFEPFDSRAIEIKDEKSWLSSQYKFTDIGIYDIYVMDESRKKLAEDSLIIIPEEKSDWENSGLEERFFMRNYYADIQLTYCERVIAGKPVNVRNYTSISKYNGEIYVYLNNNKPMRTDTIFVDVWFRNIGEDDFKDFEGTKKFILDGKWYDTFFRYVFEKIGEYKFDIYTENHKLIKSSKMIRVYE